MTWGTAERGMSVSVVQGYVCFSSCDEAKARAGKNPHPKAGEGEFGDTGIRGANDPAAAKRGDLAAGRAVSPIDARLSGDALEALRARGGVDILV
jgi:hypothetical protein